jgi:cullin 3
MFRKNANRRPPNVKGITGDDALDFDAVWGTLRASIRQIHTKEASTLSFEQLYRNAYKIVLKKRGESLYENVKEFVKDWLLNEIQPRILAVLSSSLLAGNVGPGAATQVNEKRVAGERLMNALKQAWQDHNACMGMTTDVLMYMVRTRAVQCFWRVCSH